jgi:transcriptional regulator with XRE-family HTH domain
MKNGRMTGAGLRDIRKQAGLTQAQFAQVLHLSPAFVGEMERGEKAIEPRTADLARWSLNRRVSVGTFGDRFVVILSEPIRGVPGRSHRIMPGTHSHYHEAEAAAETFCAESPGWRYMKRPVVRSAISLEGDRRR